MSCLKHIANSILSNKFAILAILAVFVAGCETGTKNPTKATKTACLVDTDCSNNSLCVDNSCVESTSTCTFDIDCGATENCNAGVCVDVSESVDECASDSDCTEGYICDTTGDKNACVVDTNQGECKTDDDCAEGETCSDNNGTSECVEKEEEETAPTFDISSSELDNINCREDITWKVRALNSNISAFTWTISGLPEDITYTIGDKNVTFKRNDGGCTSSDREINLDIQACSKAKPENCFPKSYDITIKGLEPITLKSSDCELILGAQGSCQLEATGGYNGVYEWDLNGALPEGYTFDKSSGTITGQPNDLIVKTVNVLVTSGDMPQAEFSVTITPKESLTISALKNIDCVGGLVKTTNLSDLVIGRFVISQYCEGTKPLANAKKHQNMLYLSIPAIDGQSYSWSSNSSMFTVEGGKHGAHVKPTASYDGTAKNVTFTVKKDNSDIENSISFSNLTFEDYPCKAPEITIKRNGEKVAAESLDNVLPGQSLKNVKILPSNGWRVSGLESNAITFKSTKKGWDKREPHTPMQYAGDKNDFSDLGKLEAAVEYPNPVMEPYLRVNMEKDSCTSISKVMPIKVATPSKNEKLKYFIVETGAIADTGDGSYFQINVYGPNNSKFSSEQIHMEDRKIDKSTFAVDEWTDEAGKHMRIPNININNIKQVEISIHDGDGVNDLSFYIRKITLLSRSYFAVMDKTIGGTVDSLKTYDLRLGAAAEGANYSEISGATVVNFSTQAFYDSGEDMNKTIIENADGLFLRSNIRIGREIFVHQELNLSNKSEDTKNIFLYGNDMLFAGGELVNLTKADDDGDDVYSSNDELKSLINCWHSDPKMPTCTYRDGDNICVNDGNGSPVCKKSTEVAY